MHVYHSVIVLTRHSITDIFANMALIYFITMAAVLSSAFGKPTEVEPAPEEENVKLLRDTFIVCTKNQLESNKGSGYGRQYSNANTGYNVNNVYNANNGYNANNVYNPNNVYNANNGYNPNNGYNTNNVYNPNNVYNIPNNGYSNNQNQIGNGYVGENVYGNVNKEEEGNKDVDFLQCADYAWQVYKEHECKRKRCTTLSANVGEFQLGIQAGGGGFGKIKREQ